jgi:hypothetical protein
MKRCYNNGTNRDFGAVLPLNIPIKVVVSSAHLLFSDEAGSALAPGGLALQMSPSDPQLAPATSSHSWHFRSPGAKIIHIFTSSVR